jgi:uncharacterized membrane protein YkvI
MGGSSLNKKLSLYFQIAAVFIGTVVGAGLASGQEISHFFYCIWIQKFFRNIHMPNCIYISIIFYNKYKFKI